MTLQTPVINITNCENGMIVNADITPQLDIIEQGVTFTCGSNDYNLNLEVLPPGTPLSFYDLYISAGTYSNGFIFFSGHGINFLVDLTPLVVSTGYGLTGATLSGDTLILTNTAGYSFYVDFSQFNYSTEIGYLDSKIDYHTGDTGNPHQTSFSNLVSTAHTHTLSEIIDYTVPFDTYLTAGTYSDGYIYFSGHGNNFIVDVTDLLDDTNTYVTGGTLSGDTLVLMRNDGVNIYVDQSQFNYNDKIDSHTGDTNNPHQTTFNNLILTAHTHTISEIDDINTVYFSGNTSGDCIGDIYVSNIHACSPLNIYGDITAYDSLTMGGLLTLAFGTTTVPPLKFQNGTLIAVAEPGAIEFDTDDYYATISTPFPGAIYTSQYPPAYSNTYVKATSTYDIDYPHIAFNPSVPLTGNAVSGNRGWAANDLVNQRLHVDLGEPKIINRIYYENCHDAGAYTSLGLNNFTFWGSNSADSFVELTYGTDTGWTELSVSQNTFDEHIALDQADPKYILVTNITAYRYYAIKIADSHDTWNFMYVRRIELQTGGVGYPRCPIVLSDGTNLTNTYLPVAQEDGRLVDSVIKQVGSDIYYKGEELDNRYLNATGDTIYGNVIINGDLTVTGNTYLQALSATSISIGGTDINNIFLNITGNTYVTGSTMSGDTLVLTRNDGAEITQDLSQFNYDDDINYLDGKIDSHTGDTIVHLTQIEKYSVENLLISAVTITYGDNRVTVATSVNDYGHTKTTDFIYDTDNNVIEITEIYRLLTNIYTINRDGFGNIITINKSYTYGLGTGMTYSTPGTYVWNVPSGVTSIKVKCYGGGGRGAAGLWYFGYSLLYSGGGGGGGGYAEKTFTALTASSYTIHVEGSSPQNYDASTNTLYSWAVDSSQLKAMNGGSAYEVTDVYNPGMGGGYYDPNIGDFTISGGNGGKGDDNTTYPVNGGGGGGCAGTDGDLADLTASGGTGSLVIFPHGGNGGSGVGGSQAGFFPGGGSSGNEIESDSELGASGLIIIEYNPI